MSDQINVEEEMFTVSTNFIDTVDDDDDDSSYQIPQLGLYRSTMIDGDDDDDEQLFKLPDKPIPDFDDDDDDDDESFYNLMVVNQATSLSEFVYSQNDEILDYQYALQNIDMMKGIKKDTNAIISTRVRTYLESRLKSIYPGYLTSFTSKKYRNRQNLIEYLRSYVMECASSYVHDEENILDHKTIQRNMVDIFLNEELIIPDSTGVAVKIADAVYDAFDITVNDLTASLVSEISSEPVPVYPKQIHTNAYVCDCGFVQKTKHPMPSLIMNNSRSIYYQEAIQCQNCNRDIIIPSEVAKTLEQVLKATITTEPAMSKDTFCIYRPPLESIEVPPHLSNVLIFDETPVLEEEFSDDEQVNIYSSFYKDLVNDWTRESLSLELPYLTQLFNTKMFKFDLKQEWKNWTASVLHFLDFHGVLSFTPWSEQRYSYTNQPYMTVSESFAFIDKYFHYISGLRVIQSVVELPHIKEEFRPIFKEMFMYRCLSQTTNWVDSDLRSYMTKDKFNIKKPVNISCSPGLAYQNDRKILPTLSVFEDYESLKAYLADNEIPARDDIMINPREHFNEFKSLFIDNAEKIFKTSITDYYIVTRTFILRFLERLHLLNESVSPVYENHKHLEFAKEVDYKLYTYFRLSDRLPPVLFEARLSSGIEEMIKIYNDDSSVQEELENINPEWRSNL